MKKVLFGMATKLLVISAAILPVRAQGIEAVNTGDDFKLFLWVGIAVLALLAAFAATFLGKKKIQKEDEKDEDEQSSAQ